MGGGVGYFAGKSSPSETGWTEGMEGFQAL
jgi:hypothetical protein